MRSKRRLKRNLIILKKEREDICFEMGLDYEVIKCKLIDCYKTEKDFKQAIKRTKIRKKFKKVLAKELGVKYSAIKHRFPVDFNSTTIASFLDPHLHHLSHQEIRQVCQKLKLKFDDYL